MNSKLRPRGVRTFGIGVAACILFACFGATNPASADKIYEDPIDVKPACTIVNPLPNAAGNLVIMSGSVCLINATDLNDLTVTSGATLYMAGTNVWGRFKAVQAARVILCGNLFVGHASIAQTAGTVLVGQGPDGIACGGNEFDENLNLLSNNLTRSGYVEVGSNYFPNGYLSLVSNRNGTAAGNQDIEVEGNVVAGKLTCLANSPAPTNGGYPNQAGIRIGQCTAGF